MCDQPADTQTDLPTDKLTEQPTDKLTDQARKWIIEACARTRNEKKFFKHKTVSEFLLSLHLGNILMNGTCLDPLDAAYHKHSKNDIGPHCEWVLKKYDAGTIIQVFFSFQLRLRISMRGRVHPSVSPSVRKSVRCYFRLTKNSVFESRCVSMTS